MYIYIFLVTVQLAFSLKSIFIIVYLRRNNCLSSYRIIPSAILIIVISYFLSFSGRWIQNEYIGLAGWIPICIGFKILLGGKMVRYREELLTFTDTMPGFRSILWYYISTAAIYTPLFLHFGSTDKLYLSAVTMLFNVMLILFLVSIPFNRKSMLLIYTFGKPIYALLLIVTGFYILFLTGTYKAFF